MAVGHKALPRRKMIVLHRLAEADITCIAEVQGEVADLATLRGGLGGLRNVGAQARTSRRWWISGRGRAP